VDRVELVQRIGIRARQTTNMVERLHETLKERTRPMRGLKTKETGQNILDRYAVNYNYIREHQSIKMMCAQRTGIEITNEWSELIERATKEEEARAPETQLITPEIVVS
jgi:hypothetical protein